IHLVIVGDGSYRKELEIGTDTLGIRSLVHFYGYKPFNEMLEILAGADAAIIPHLRTDNNDASSPNKLYQYMYLNKPVISSDCISLKRIINETRTGFIYNNELPEDLASLIEKLRSDKNTLESAGRNGRKAVMEKYNWTFDKKRLTGVYDQLNNMNTLH
ncbi:MAG TPA: glycosyltransferase, partial [Bacteroidales bacterium]|nr:glycosyltransferase [Bacteroidales bacterium]